MIIEIYEDKYCDYSYESPYMVHIPSDPDLVSFAHQVTFTNQVDVASYTNIYWDIKFIWIDKIRIWQDYEYGVSGFEVTYEY